MANTMKSQRGKGGGGIGPEETLVAAPLTKGSASGSGVNPPGRRQEDDVNIVAFSENQRGELVESPYAHQLTSGGGKPGQGYPAVALHQTQEPIHGEEFAPAIGRTSIGMGLSNASGVRRLTPVECERLQGLPDNWTRLDAKTPDSRRYSALGDAVTANVAEWIRERLAKAERDSPAAADPISLLVRLGGDV